MNEIGALMKRAKELLATADGTLRRGDSNTTANRAYYAMFHAVHALLLARGLRPASHGGTMSLFAQHFIKTGEVDSRFGTALTKAYMLRHKSDYDVMRSIRKDEARAILRAAKDFVTMVERLLASSD
jgi:uncharacterized protein (UPF0332 family)